jgi:hypothetical protein
MANTFTVNIYQENVLRKTFSEQKSDIEAFGYLINKQHNSINRALRFDGWEVEVINEQTLEKYHWSKTYSTPSIRRDENLEI